MKVSEALLQRKSVRAFTHQEVDKLLIKNILISAGFSPSGVNSQPWCVHVLSGQSKLTLQALIEKEFRKGVKMNMDYQYYPIEWVEPYRSRRKECGLQMYSALNISREDKQQQQDQWAANYRSFDAPVMMLFSMDAVFDTGSYLDFGIFLQSLMLAVTEQGLATCPQVSLSEYPDIVKPFIKIASDAQLICGMALGYEDTLAAINHYRTSRVPIDDWVTFLS